MILSHVPIKGIIKTDIERIASGCSTLILLGEYDMVFQDNLNLKMPVVCGEMHNNLGGTASLFEMDQYQSADIAVEYFKKHKKSHVKCYTGNNPVGIARIEQFKLLWINAGGTIEFQKLSSHQEVADFCFEPNGAFLFSSGWLMDSFCKRSKSEFDLKLTESATILGLDGRCCFDPQFDPAPTIYADWKQIGHDIYLECMRRIKNPGITPRRYYYPVKLIESQ